MKVHRLDKNRKDSWDGWHILTVAEAGFSMLDIYGRYHYGLDIEVIKSFAERVNETDESGSLYPKAPISAIPRYFFRNLKQNEIPYHISAFKRHIRDFLETNNVTVKADKLLVDFHVSSADPIPGSFLDALEEELSKFANKNRFIKEVIILDCLRNTK
jgi:hypothetical protein